MRYWQSHGHASTQPYQKVLLVAAMLLIFCRCKRMGAGHTPLFRTVTALGNAIA